MIIKIIIKLCVSFLIKLIKKMGAVMPNKNNYWKANIALIVKYLSIWFIVSYLFGIVFAGLVYISLDSGLRNKVQYIHL